jgi:outer membrane protein
MSKRLIAASMVIASALCAPRFAHAKGEDVVIGYVNIQRAILEVEEGKRAKENLKKTFDAKQASLSAKETELKKMKDELEKQSVVKNPNDPATAAQRKNFQDKLMELQQVFVKEQQELQQEEQKMLSGITEKMKKVIAEIGDQGGYTLILEIQDSRLLYAKAHLDLTNEVIRKYNSRYK